MKIDLPFAEAMEFVATSGALPPVIQAMRCDGSTVHFDIDLQAMPDPPLAVRIAAAAAGTVSATARITGFSAGVITFAITAHARGLPAHKLLPYLLDPVNAALRQRGLPDGLVEIRRGEPDPLVLIDVQKAVDAKVLGITVTDVGVRDEVISMSAQIGEVRLL